MEKSESKKPNNHTCPMHPEVISDKAGQCPKCSMNLVNESKEVSQPEDKQPTEFKPSQGGLYTCPMHPEVMLDAPGKCPKCGMELVMKHEPTPTSPAATEGELDHTAHHAKMGHSFKKLCPILA